jgi:hypothetical protein
LTALRSDYCTALFGQYLWAEPLPAVFGTAKLSFVLRALDAFRTFSKMPSPGYGNVSGSTTRIEAMSIRLGWALDTVPRWVEIASCQGFVIFASGENPASGHVVGCRAGRSTCTTVEAYYYCWIPDGQY